MKITDYGLWFRECYNLRPRTEGWTQSPDIFENDYEIYMKGHLIGQMDGFYFVVYLDHLHRVRLRLKESCSSNPTYNYIPEEHYFPYCYIPIESDFEEIE